MKTRSKLKHIKDVDYQDQSVPRPMLSMEESSGFLNKRRVAYTDEEIGIIREFMYCVAEITSKQYQRIEENKSKEISITQINQNEAKSIPIHPRKYRRAS